jgi:hypothetical protein
VLEGVARQDKEGLEKERLEKVGSCEIKKRL